MKSHYSLETSFQHQFRMIRLVDDGLLASDFEITVDITVDKINNGPKIKERLKAMRFWLSTYVDGCIAYDVHSKLDTTLLEQISNHIMMTPDEPHDHLILTLIYSKLSTIGGNEIAIESVTLLSDSNEGFSFTVGGDSDEILPDIKSWMGDRYFWDSAWWNRPDSSMMDMIPEPEDDINVKPPLGINLIEIVTDQNDQETTVEQTKSAEIIKPSFKLRVIDANTD